MPILILMRLVTSALSLAILGAAIYLAWSWDRGETYYAVDGARVFYREDWRIWAAAAIAVWSVLGRFMVKPFLGRADSPQTMMKLERGPGEFIDTPTGARLYVERVGDRSKPTILFTHGWGLDSTIWQYAKRDLADRFHLVFWDLPGLGRSKKGAIAEESPTRFAEDLQAVMDYAGAKPVVLVGHSIGGMTIQSLVRDAPERARVNVAGIVLLNTTYTNPIKTAYASSLIKSLRWPVLEPVLLLTRWLQPIAWANSWRSYFNGSAHIANRIQFGRKYTKSQLNAVTLLGTRNPPGVLARGNQDMFRWDATGAIRKFAGPVLAIGGKVDLATKIEASRVIADDAPDGHLLEVDGVNHNGFLEDSEAYNAAISAFAVSAFAGFRKAG